MLAPCLRRDAGATLMVWDLQERHPVHTQGSVCPFGEGSIAALVRAS